MINGTHAMLQSRNRLRFEPLPVPSLVSTSLSDENSFSDPAWWPYRPSRPRIPYQPVFPGLLL